MASSVATRGPPPGRMSVAVVPDACSARPVSYWAHRAAVLLGAVGIDTPTVVPVSPGVGTGPADMSPVPDHAVEAGNSQLTDA
jgi:hypothetical protein